MSPVTEYIRLPAGYVWAATIEEAEGLTSVDKLALIWPGDRNRAARWATVLDWYATSTDRLSSPASPAHEQLVISVGTNLEPHGRVTASALGGTPCLVDDLASVRMLPLDGYSSVVLVAAAESCTFGALEPIDTYLRSLGIKWGLITGKDDAAITFMIAKVAAAEAWPGNRLSAVIDGTRGLARRYVHDAQSQESRSSPTLPVSELLEGDWHLLTIDAHGTSAHAYAGTHVICGLSGKEELTRYGAIASVGCNDTRCKASVPGVLEPHYLRDIRARVLLLFVCNGVTLTMTEQYPSDVSLALAAIEGYPAAILGLFRQDLETTDAQPLAAQHMLHAGHDLGSVAGILSAPPAERGLRAGYALIGNPAWRPIEASRGPDYMPLPSPDGPASQDAVIDLQRWSNRLTAAIVLEDSLDALARSSRHDSTLMDCLERMRDASSSARRLVMSELRLQLATAAPGSIENLNRHVEAQLVNLAHEWALSLHVAATQTRSVFFNRMWDRLHEFHQPARGEDVPRCSYCDSPRMSVHFKAQIFGISDRLATSCPRCGPQGEYPKSGYRVTVSAPRAVSNEHTLSIEVTTTLPYGDRTQGAAEDIDISVQLRSRASDLGVLSSVQRTVPAPGSAQVALAVPADLTPELHRVWVLVAHRFEISIGQERVAYVPT